MREKRFEIYPLRFARSQGDGVELFEATGSVAVQLNGQRLSRDGFNVSQIAAQLGLNAESEFFDERPMPWRPESPARLAARRAAGWERFLGGPTLPSQHSFRKQKVNLYD